MNGDEQRQDETGRAFQGSQRQIQTYVNRYADELSKQVKEALPTLSELKPDIRWVSPLEREKYVEYYDQGFLRAIEQPELTDALKRFWPRSGPRWDALVVAKLKEKPEQKGVILVEAKSYPIEIFGNGCGAGGARKGLIQRSLTETRQWLGVPGDVEDWKWTGPLYQYANRLAHLYFLNEIAKVPAWLVNIYFVHDPYRPTTREQWEDFLPEVKLELLGQRNFSHRLVADVLLEARP